jgi:hypothetical protein
MGWAQALLRELLTLPLPGTDTAPGRVVLELPSLDAPLQVYGRRTRERLLLVLQLWLLEGGWGVCRRCPAPASVPPPRTRMRAGSGLPVHELVPGRGLLMLLLHGSHPQRGTGRRTKTRMS